MIFRYFIPFAPLQPPAGMSHSWKSLPSSIVSIWSSMHSCFSAFLFSSAPPISTIPSDPTNPPWNMIRILVTQTLASKKSNNRWQPSSSPSSSSDNSLLPALFQQSSLSSNMCLAWNSALRPSTLDALHLNCPATVKSSLIAATKIQRYEMYAVDASCRRMAKIG